MRVRLFIFAYLLPGLCIYALYAALVYNQRIAVFGKVILAQEFRENLQAGTLRNPIGKPEVIVLGDSGAKVGLSPVDFGGAYMINLAALYGNSITAHENMRTYLEKFEPPACMAMIFQYEWRRSYSVFFGSLVRDRSLNRAELTRVWNETRAQGLFPGKNFGAFRFWWNYAKQAFYLDSNIFSRLKYALYLPMTARRWEEAARRLEHNRGQVGRNTEDYPTDEMFFNEEANVAFKKPFVPHPTEDYYLLKLADMARERNIKLFVGALPVAESEMGTKNEIYREGRRKHFENLFAGKPNVYLLNYPGTLPRENFFDFTHPNAKGGAVVTALLNEQLKDLCHPRE